MFWKRKSQQVPPARASFSVPVGRRVYAVGDVHGRDDLFAALIDMIRADSRERGDAAVTIVLLGDLVDRGPDSSSVVERARRLSEEFTDTRLLIGNHEECFLGALTGDIRKLRYFMRVGGDATIRSYWNIDRNFFEATFDEVAALLPQLVPDEHVKFLNSGQNVVEIGDYIFVHAGIRPGVPIHKQKLSDLRWIRDDFLEDERDHGVMVVHGHTITDAIDEWPNRIGIDTGAYDTGKLTAIGIEGTERWFLTTNA